ncbi:hypothetical protein CHRY9393_01940 [Chryseobacterium fistulae]|uniref:Uncharacterized protein n=1 Tax=Chryseobacterium fistulae TaxID=2675058 RepID=A0A6N4XVA8_9FLAO|nr:hypothetical protein CHRY9393_01940 [Chryseobacterium fistulae]
MYITETPLLNLNFVILSVINFYHTILTTKISNYGKYKI